MVSRAERMRALTQVIRGERKIGHAARVALNALLTYAGHQLSSGLDTAVLDSRDPKWRAAVEGGLLPAIEEVFTTAFTAAARDVIDPAPYTVRYLDSVWNRLVGVADTVFDEMRLQLESGRQAGESISQLAARIDGLLSDEQRWANRAQTIARTETIGANNAGARDSARATALLLGVDPGAVARTWLATDDGRTRESHAAADGQTILGLSSTYSVGGSALVGPGDPGGPASEIVNCRCTETFSYPGDPDYPIVLASAGSYAEEAPVTTTPPEVEPDDDTPSGAVIVALPAADDPVHRIGDEDKHATVIWLGEVADAAVTREELIDAITRWLADPMAGGELVPFAAEVTGVESLGDAGARVWMLDSPGLQGLHDALLTVAPVRDLYDAADQFPTYTPHVTIGYPPEAPDSDTDPAEDVTVDAGPLAPEVEEAAASVDTIAFDRVALWWAGEQTEWPLGATEEEEPMEPNKAVATNAVALRIRGLTFAAIAEELGYDTPQAARTAVEERIVALGGRVGTYAEEEPDTEPAVPPGEQPAPDLGPEVADMAADGDPWYGILCPEGMVSGDARRFGEGAITWRDTPLPLMYQDATALGHDGAVRVGRIDNIWRDTERYAAPMIRGNGVWDTSPVAVEAQRQVETRMLRGVSVDADSVTVELIGSDGTALDPMVDEFPEDGVVIEQATAARVSGATLCSIPAFHQAYVANGVYDPTAEEPGQGEVQPDEEQAPNAEPVPDEGVVAASAWSLTAAAVGIVRPAAAFANPQLDTEEWTARYPLGVPMTLEAAGDAYRLYGHLATWGVCHIGIDGICQEPPESFSDYGYYAAGLIPLDDGTKVRVGPITMGTGHAPLHMGWRAAMEHYDNTGTVVADVTIGQDSRGIWFAGMTRPGVTPEQVYALQAAGKISGDWREVVRGSDELELVAALVVNVPGFPIPRPAVAASGGHATAMVASGIVRTPTEVRPVGTVKLDVDSAAFRQMVGASVSRHLRVLAARDRMEQLAAARRERKVAALSARMERN